MGIHWKDSRLLRFLDRVGRRLAKSADLAVEDREDELVFTQRSLWVRLRLLQSPAHLGFACICCGLVLVALRAGHQALVGQPLFPGSDFLSVAADIGLFIAAPVLLLWIGVVGLRARHEFRVGERQYFYTNPHMASRADEPSGSDHVASGKLGQVKKPRLALEKRQALGGPSRWWVLRVDIAGYLEGLALHATPDEAEAKAVQARLLRSLGR